MEALKSLSPTSNPESFKAGWSFPKTGSSFAATSLEPTDPAKTSGFLRACPPTKRKFLEAENRAFTMAVMITTDGVIPE